MKRQRKDNNFQLELKQRLEENRKLYREPSVFGALDNPVVRFVASYLGVNPWKVLVPVAFLLSLLLRIVFGRGFSEYILIILGGG